MHILQIIPYFIPNWEYGGSVKYVYYLSKELIKSGHQVSVLSTRFDTKVPKFESYEKINIYRTKILFNIRGYGVTPQIFHDLPYSEFDIVHFHCLRNCLIDLLFSYYKKRGIPIVINAHGTISNSYDSDNFVIQKLKSIQNIYLKRFLKNANYLIAVSKLEMHDYLKFDSALKNISIIPLGVNNSVQIQNSEDRLNKKAVKFFNSKRYILYVGRIVKRKGLELLLQSFTRLLKLYPDLYLLIIGKDFGYKRVLLKIIQNNGISQSVFFLGAVDENFLSLAYQYCEFLVYPSEYEIFGLTPLEAAIFHKPSIVTDNMGVKDIIINNKIGYAIKIGNEQDLFEKMKLLIDNPQYTSTLGENAIQAIKNKYLWKNVVNRMLKIYKKLITN